jgi:hypothetical protein
MQYAEAWRCGGCVSPMRQQQLQQRGVACRCGCVQGRRLAAVLRMHGDAGLLKQQRCNDAVGKGTDSWCGWVSVATQAGSLHTHTQT